jgi:hypothetical protein
MSPREVAGLQQLAMAHGGSLTTNPHTGLPEAGFLDNMLPALAAAAAIYFTGGAAAPEILAAEGAGAAAAGAGAGAGAAGAGGLFGLGSAGTGALTGAVTGALTNRQNPLQGALMGGLSGYGIGGGMGAAMQSGLIEGPGAAGAGIADLGLSGGNAPQIEAIRAAGNVDPSAIDGAIGAKSPGMETYARPTFMQALGQQFPTGMSKAAAGIGAMSALGGFEQPQLGFAAPQQTPVNYRQQLANRRPYDPERNLYTDYGIVQPVYAAKGGTLDMKDGGFVVPADVVSHLGNGDTDAGLAVLSNKTGARPIKGQGDGMSDSIRASINGVQPARVASGEAYIDREQVSQLGKGDQKRGSKKLHAMMDKVRKARTGTAKQGKQINADRFVPA